MLKLTTDRHEASRGLFATALLLVGFMITMMHLMDYVSNIHSLFWHYDCWRLEYLMNGINRYQQPVAMAIVLLRNLIVTGLQQYNNYCTFCGIFLSSMQVL